MTLWRIGLVVAFLALAIDYGAAQPATVVTNCGTLGTAPYTAGQTRQMLVDANGNHCVDTASTPITSVVSAAAENNHVLKAAPGQLVSVYAANLTATAGYLVILNAVANPADGAITPLDCANLPANGLASISYSPGPYAIYSVGIVAVVTSAATCFTKTTSGGMTAFISGRVK
jgi:hypothetical protein